MKSIALSPRATTTALVISLTLNLFLSTWIGVRWYRHSHRHPWLSVEAVEQRYLARLDGGDADVFRRVLTAHRSELVGRVEAARLARDNVQRVLQVEPFDHTRLETAFAESRQAMTAMQAALQSALLDAASELSLTGRQRLFGKFGGGFATSAEKRPTETAPHD